MCLSYRHIVARILVVSVAASLLLATPPAATGKPSFNPFAWLSNVFTDEAQASHGFTQLSLVSCEWEYSEDTLQQWALAYPENPVPPAIPSKDCTDPAPYPAEYRVIMSNPHPSSDGDPERWGEWWLNANSRPPISSYDEGCSGRGSTRVDWPEPHHLRGTQTDFYQPSHPSSGHYRHSCYETGVGKINIVGAGGAVLYDSDADPKFQKALATPPPSLPEEQAMGADGVAVGTVADPVNTATGDLTEAHVDLSVPDLRTDVSVGRTYNSSDTRAGVLGPAWRASFEYTAWTSATGDVTVSHPSGRRVLYKPDGAGGFATPPGAAEKLQLVDGLLRLVTENQRVEFNADGKAKAIVSTGTGETLTYTYTGANVTKIAGPTRSITLGYLNGRLDTATADDGRVVRYGYHDGRLTSVTSPAGKKVIYDYERTPVQDDASAYSNEVETDAPVAYWRLGDSTGSQAVDRRGTYHGIYDGPERGAAPASYKDKTTAASFDGVNDSVSIPHASAFPGTAGLTLEAWVKPDATSPTYQPIISKGAAGTFEIAADFRSTPAPRSLAWRSDSGTAYQFANFFTSDLDGQFVHVAVTVSGTTATAYRNGRLFGTITIGTRTANTLDVSIGRSTGQSSWFKGTLDEVAVYGKVLTAGRVAAHYRAARPYAAEVLNDKPIAFWTLGDQSGTVAKDAVGNHDATYDATGVSLGATGSMLHDFDHAVTFNGGSALAADHPALSGTGNLTLEAWVRTNGADTYQAIVSKGSSGPYELAADMRTSSSTYRTLQFRTGGTITSFPLFFNALLDQKWVHVAVTVSGTSATAYRNGRSLGTQTIGTRTANTNAVGIARRPGGTSKFTGDLDEVAIYGKVLSGTRIAAHYRTGRPYAGEVAADAPVAYLRLGERSTSAITAMDERGTHDGTYMNGAVRGEWGAVGANEEDTAVRLDGIDDGVSLFNNSALAGTSTGLTLEAWVKPTASANTYQPLISKGTPGPYEIAADMRDGTNKRALVWRSNSVSVNVAGFFSSTYDGQWVHVAVAISGTTAVVYRNGKAYKTVTISTRPSNTNDVFLGRRPGSYPTKGAVDEFAYYSKQLTAQRIQAHYDAAKWYPQPTVVGPQQTVTTHRLVSATGPDGVPIHQTAYDNKGRVKSQTDRNGGETLFAYDVNDAWTGTVTATDASGGQWVDRYENRVLVARTTADGVTTKYTWDPQLRLKFKEDPFTWSSYGYDSQGRLAATHTPEGSASTAYDIEGRVSWEESPTGVQTTFGYDAEGRLETATNSVTHGVTRYTYYPNHLVETVTDAGNGVTKFEYNAVGQVTKTTSPTLKVATYGYYPEGWVEWTETAAGRVSYTYTKDGDLKTVTDPKLQVSKRIFDPATHQLKRVEDHAERFTEYRYDSAGRVEVTTDHSGAKVAFGYDDAGHVTSQMGCRGTNPDDVCTAQQAEHRASATTFDEAGRPQTVSDSTGSMTFQYVGGLKKKIIQPDQSEIVFDHDTRGRLTSTTTGTSDPEKVTYDKFGRVATQERGTSQKLTYTYNTLSQVISVRSEDTVLGTDETTAYTYDKMGRTATITRPNNAVEKFVYFPDGSVHQVKRNGGLLAEYAYDSAGRVKTITRVDGTVEHFTYDELSRPETRRIQSGTDVIEREEITYDVRGNPVKVVGLGTEVTTYGYDADDQLTRVCEGIADPTSCTDAGATQVFTYDDFGNRLTRTTAAGVESYGYNDLDQLTSVCQGVINAANCASSTATKSLTYDDRGRAKTVGPLTLTYDEGSGRLTGAAHTDGRSWSWRYNPVGAQVQATEIAVDGNPTSTTFGVDPLSGSVASTKTGGPTATATETPTETGFPPPPVEDPTLSHYLPAGLGRINNHEYEFAHKDRLGSPSIVTGSLGGEPAAVLHSYDFDAFGAEKASTAPDPSSNRTFGNHVRGPEGLVVMQGRPYDPSTGRFLTPDPQGATYIYAENNPLRYNDPSGQVSCEPTWQECAATVSKWSSRISMGLTIFAVVVAVAAAPLTGGTSLAVAAGAVSSGAFAAARVADVVSVSAGVAGACGGKGSCAGSIGPIAMGIVASKLRLPKGSGTIGPAMSKVSSLTDDAGDMAFAHGTSTSAAHAILDGGLDEAAARGLSKRARYARPGSFHTFKVTPGNREGVQLAYEMGGRHGDDCVVLVCRLPAATVRELMADGHVRVESIPGVVIPQTVFGPGAYPRINQEGVWQLIKPGG